MNNHFPCCSVQEQQKFHLMQRQQQCVNLLEYSLYQYITEKAESSSGTTERIMSGNPKQDIMRATARRYEQAVIGPVGQFECYLEYYHVKADQIDTLLAEIATLREEAFYWRCENDRKARIIDKLLG